MLHRRMTRPDGGGVDGAMEMGFTQRIAGDGGDHRTTTPPRMGGDLIVRLVSRARTARLHNDFVNVQTSSAAPQRTTRRDAGPEEGCT